MTLDIGFTFSYFIFRLVSRTLFMIFFLNKTSCQAILESCSTLTLNLTLTFLATLTLLYYMKGVKSVKGIFTKHYLIKENGK